MSERTPEMTPASHQDSHGDLPAQQSQTLRETPSNRMEDIAHLTEEELDGRIKAAREQQRLRKKREYLLALGRGEAPEITFETLEDQPRARTSLERDSKRPRSSGWGKLQLPCPRYRGKSWMELQSFLVDLESYFLTQPEAFQQEGQRVIYASSCLEADTKRRWTNYLMVDRDNQLSSITWPQFVEWLKDGINNGPTRCLEATAKLANLSQRQGQRFQSFLDYYESVESELPDRLPDSFRICSFIQRLNAPLCKQL